jgi:ankyrin repeat protein
LELNSSNKSEILIEKNDVLNSLDVAESSALHYACHRGYFEIAKTLLLAVNQSSSVSFVDSANKSGFTCLMYSCGSGNLPIARLIMSNYDGKGKAWSSIADKQNPWDGKSALHYAVIHGRLRIIYFLLFEAGANVWIRDYEGRNAFFFAVRNLQLSSLVLLIAKSMHFEQFSRISWAVLIIVVAFLLFRF